MDGFDEWFGENFILQASDGRVTQDFSYVFTEKSSRVFTVEFDSYQLEDAIL